mgnify:FL=1
MSLVLFLLSLAMIPSIAFYYYGSSVDAAEKENMILQSPLNWLFFTTIGSLGTGARTCMEASYGESFDLACESGILKSISVEYGQPTGYCQCPAAQKPTDESGTCPGKKASPKESPWGICNQNMACFLTKTNPMEEECCAFSLADPENGDFSPSLSGVDVAASEGCSSTNAQYLIEGQCIGQTNCTVVLEDGYAFGWEGVCEGEDAECSQFMTVDVDKNCTGTDRKMIVVGTCASETVTFNGGE